ncbi:MAG: hypothetical protein J6Q36_07155 [Alistipes sp.]|nr:hypothetical protein [Alistipes sp.]
MDTTTKIASAPTAEETIISTEKPQRERFGTDVGVNIFEELREEDF